MTFVPGKYWIVKTGRERLITVYEDGSYYDHVTDFRSTWHISERYPFSWPKGFKLIEPLHKPVMLFKNLREKL